MRPSSKTTAITLLLAGLVARSALARPLCSSDLQGCPAASSDEKHHQIRCGEASQHLTNSLAARAFRGPPKHVGGDHDTAGPSGPTKDGSSGTVDGDGSSGTLGGDGSSGSVDQGDVWGQPSGSGPGRGDSTAGDTTTTGDSNSGATPGRPAGGDGATVTPVGSGGIDSLPDVETKGYSVTKGNKEYHDDVYLINSRETQYPDGTAYTEGYLAKIRSNKDEGSITVDDAHLTKDDNHGGDPKGDADRARLWEMQATVAKRSGMEPSTIKQLGFTEVIEKETVDVVKQSRTKLGKGEDEAFEVSRDSADPIEKQVFDDNLSRATFGKNVQKFLNNVPTGKQVTKIEGLINQNPRGTVRVTCSHLFASSNNSELLKHDETTPDSMLRAKVNSSLLRTSARTISSRSCQRTAPKGGQKRWIGRFNRNEPTEYEANHLNQPANDLGGPGGQELYPYSSRLHRRYRTETVVGIMASLAAMFIAKRTQWVRDPNIVNVLVHDSSKGELDDVKMIPVRVDR
ncbi:hypothetical protein B0H66DRAFT_626368 [Apodospora peruviana]|uniref:Uncharacterized protein n=1 Tax=Apodospora peruviana TaxID=516989 RepID=A0AAE0M2F8_9PEZI|nr:hypothetical protein B0H66DRAFT_626368 [Apodospora peruviana]